MPNLIVSAVSTFDNKGLKKGQKEISAFDKSVKSLGKTFAGVFGATALLNYGKNAVKAFAADEAAAKALELQLKNTGNAFAAPAVEMYIANLQKTTGVIDDQLRPAFQQLLTVTKSVVLSQAALDTALNVSAATGKSLTEVAAALSRGYAGNTTALTRLGVGLDKTTLKSGDMNKILEELNQKFAGQAQARLTTYAGKMDLLNISAQNVKETIGKGILDALTLLGKDKSIENLTGDFEKLAAGIAATIVDLAELINKLQQIPGFDFLFDVKNIPVVGTYLNYFMNRGAQAQTPTFTPFGQAGSAAEAARLAELKRLRDAAKLRATENALIKEKNALEDLKKKYDVERIGLMAALNNATDEETKLRIAEKLAILDGNAAKVQEYLAAEDARRWRMQEIESLKELTASQYLAASSMTKLADWVAYRTGERASATSILSSGSATTAGGVFIPSPTMTMASDYAAYRAGERGDIIVNVEGSVLTDDDLTNTIQRTILQINKQGRGTTPAGGLSGGT
jgi:hypothetical protein